MDPDICNILNSVHKYSISSPIAVEDESPREIKILVTTINSIELCPENDLDESSDSSDATSLSDINSDDISSFVSDTFETFSESSNIKTSTLGSEQDVPTSVKQLPLKRTCSSNSFSSTRSPTKKHKDEQQTKIMLEKLEQDRNIYNMQAARLEELLSPFEQYIKQQQNAIAIKKQKLPLLKHDPDNNLVSVRDSRLLKRSWTPVNIQAVRKFTAKVLPVPANQDGADETVCLSVIVSAVQDPAHIYVTFEDDQSVRFEKMLEEMQSELERNGIFETPEKWIGHVCAVKINNRWFRVVVEEEDSSEKVDVFFVDNGRRLGIRKNSCYFLPERFLEIPAQALRCALDGLQPVNPANSEAHDTCDWHWQVITYLQRQRQKKGKLFAERLSLGEVGRFPAAQEFGVHGILHIYGEEVSINRWLCDNNHAATDRPIDIPGFQRRQSVTTVDLSTASGSTEIEDDKISAISSASRITNLTSKSISIAEESLPFWYEMGAKVANQGFHDRAHSEKNAKSCYNQLIVPAGMNSQRVFRKKSTSISSRKLPAKKLIEETIIGPLVFSWCESPYAIFLQTAEMQEKLTSLMESMELHYQDTKPTGSKFYEIGNRCAVFRDGRWWRAMIVNNDAFPDCEVKLTDRGFRCNINALQIRPLDAKFQDIKKLILCVKLTGVFPPAGIIWGNEVKKFLSERLSGGDDIKFYYFKDEQVSDEFLSGVIAYDYVLEEGPLQYGGLARIKLNDELISLELASRTHCPRKYEPRPASWKPPVHPNPGERFWAKVTWVNMEGEIYLHDVRTEGKLQDMTRQLTKYYNKTQPSKEDVKPRIGELCIAKYTDGSWYRCVVKDLKPNEGNAILNYEDYGTRDATKLGDIRLNVMFEDIPIQGWRCKLHNIRPINDYWDWDTLTSIHKLIVDNEFTCNVIAKYPLTVALSRGGKLLADELVERGLVSYEIMPDEKQNKLIDRTEVINVGGGITMEVIDVEDDVN